MTRAGSRGGCTVPRARCGCGRCRDPGERGTWLGGVVCTRCRGPALAPAWQPGRGGWAWRCGGCGFVANTAKVAALLARLEQEMDQERHMADNLVAAMQPHLRYAC